MKYLKEMWKTCKGEIVAMAIFSVVMCGLLLSGVAEISGIVFGVMIVVVLVWVFVSNILI